MFRGGLGASRRDKQRAVGGRSRGIGRYGSDDEGDGGGAEGFSGGDQEFGGAGRGDFLGAESHSGFRRIRQVVG